MTKTDLTTATGFNTLVRSGIVSAFVLAAVACQAGVKAPTTEFLVRAAYSPDADEVIQDNGSTTQYIVYVEQLADTKRGAPSFTDQKRMVTYANGKFVEGALVATTQKEARDNLMDLEGDRSEIIDRLMGGEKNYYVKKGFEIGSGAVADAGITLQGDAQVASKVVLHIGGRDYQREYDGGFVRTIYPVPGNAGAVYLGVIIDYCGASSCHSEIEILSASSK